MDESEIEKKADEPEVIKLLNLILIQVLRDNGQVLELHPSGYRVIEYINENEVELRQLPKKYYDSVVSRIEIMAGIDPLTDFPQVGEFSLDIISEKYLLSIYSEKLLAGKYLRADIEKYNK